MIKPSQIRKLRKTSTDEIRVRLGGALRKRKERSLWARHRLTAPQSARINEERFLSDVTAIVPGAIRRQLDRLNGEASLLRTEISSQSATSRDAIMSGTWEMLGHPFDLAGDVDWHRDPRTDHEFPRVFYADVPLHQDVDDGVDVKYVWELGRLQFLPELARSWQFSKNEEAAVNARRLLMSWIDQNPIYEGVHWTSGLEVAVRAISCIWTLATLADWDGWQDGDLDRIASSLAGHATYLKHHFSYYSSPYNHLIGEATGLLLISQALCQHSDAERWRSTARQVLEGHGPKQFYGDGFCVEQATGYHFFSLGFLAMAIVAARQDGATLACVEKAAHKAFRTGVLFQQPDGRWPAIGDVDSARAIPVHHDDFWNFESLCSLAAVLFDDPQLKRPDSKPGEELYWLLGCDGVERFHRLKAVEPDGFKILPESGYAVGRKGNDWLCFDAGPIAHGLHSDATPSTAHGHLDTLQVLYFHNGESILCDSGMPHYFQDRDWVRHFRGVSAHNSIEVEGVEFARDVGRLTWSHATSARLSEEKTADSFWLAHGHTAWDARVSIDRYVLAMPGEGLWIVDRIRSDSPRDVCWHWQLPAEICAEIAEVSDTQCHIHTKSIQLTASAERPIIHCALHQSDPGSPVGWKSDGYGQQAPGTSVVISQDGVTDLLFMTGFTSGQHDVEVTTDGRSLRCSTIKSDGQADCVESFQTAQCGDSVTWRIRTKCRAASGAAAEESNHIVSAAGLAKDRY